MKDTQHTKHVLAGGLVACPQEDLPFSNGRVDTVLTENYEAVNVVVCFVLLTEDSKLASDYSYHGDIGQLPYAPSTPPGLVPEFSH